MRFTLFPIWAIGLWGVIVLPLPSQVNANTPLTRAEIQELHNLVQLIPRRTNKRPARKTDAIIPGDGLSTGRSSLVDLRFNDGSLARVGEQAVFQFLPKTRNFKLSNGTVLLLIPPGRGQTRIQTPSAAAAIRGSALFVRYDRATDTTIVGALTNSGIGVLNKEASQSQELRAGQLIVIVKGKFQSLYDFDLRNFYQTSDLVQGLDLTRQNASSKSDPAIASVQAEIIAAVAAQLPISGAGVIDNPSFLQLSANSSSEVDQDTTSDDSSADTITDDSLIDSFVETGQILLDTAQGSENNIPDPTTEPIVPPPITQPVIPNPTTEPIVPPPITQPVIPDPTTEPIVPPPITQPVIPDPTTQPVIPDPTTQPIIPNISPQ